MRKYIMLMALPLLMAFAHPIHVSVCDIEYDKANQALEVVQRIFVDDLEKAVRLHSGKQSLDIGLEDAKVHIQAYIVDKLHIRVNGKAVSYAYLGHEIEGEALYAYIEIEKVKKLSELEVTSEILTAMYDDQVNLVHVKVDGALRSLKLTSSSSSESLSY